MFYGDSIQTTGATGASVFSVGVGGDFKILHQFPQFYDAMGGIQAMNGQYFGWGLYTSGGFNYQYFSMPLDGSSLQVFLLGTFGTPEIGEFAVPSPDGYLYNTTINNSQVGALVRVDLEGKITAVHTFNPTTEGVPYLYGGLVRSHDGSFYGIATDGTPATVGWIFKIDVNGNYTKGPQFPGNWLGAVPAALVMSPEGVIYGTLNNGGTNLTGAIYKYVPGGQMTTLYSSPKFRVIDPNALLLAADGNLYGGTRTSPSWLFGFNLRTNKFQPLYQMKDTDGTCGCVFLQGSDGKIYGAAQTGGANGFGSVFSLDVGIAPPKPHVSLFAPTSGSTGQKILLWGRNFLGATAVSFNGVPALGFTVTTSYSVYATVPPGATTGPITITTPAGTFQTTSSFTVP